MCLVTIFKKQEKEGGDEMVSFTEENLGLELFDIGAFMDKTKSSEGKGFKLVLHDTKPDAPLSPCYLNLRTPDHPTKPGLLTSIIIMNIAHNLYRLSVKNGLAYNFVAGIPEAGTPIVKAFAHAFYSDKGYQIPVLKLVKKEEGNREIELVRKNFHPGQKVLLIDDLITRAGSKFNAIQAIETTGLKVKDVLVLIDQEQGGKEELKEKGCNLHSVFLFSKLLTLYFEKARIDYDLYQEIVMYLGIN